MKPYMNYAVNVDFDCCLDENRTLEGALAWFFTDEAKDIYEDDWEDAKTLAVKVYNKRLNEAKRSDVYKLESDSIELLQHVTRNLTNDLVAFEFVVDENSHACHILCANKQDLAFYAEEYVNDCDANTQYKIMHN